MLLPVHLFTSHLQNIFWFFTYKYEEHKQRYVSSPKFIGKRYPDIILNQVFMQKIDWEDFIEQVALMVMVKELSNILIDSIIQ